MLLVGRSQTLPRTDGYIYAMFFFFIVQYQDIINDHMIDLWFSTHQPKEDQTQATIQNDILELFFV